MYKIMYLADSWYGHWTLDSVCWMEWSLRDRVPNAHTKVQLQIVAAAAAAVAACSFRSFVSTSLTHCPFLFGR